MGVLNIVTGVVVDSAIQKGNAERSVRFLKEMDCKKRFVQDVMELLVSMDADCDGEISESEWIGCINDQRIQQQISMLGIKALDMEMLFDVLDDDDDGKLNVWDLVEGLNRLGGNATSLDLHHALKLLKH